MFYDAGSAVGEIESTLVCGEVSNLLTPRIKNKKIKRYKISFKFLRIITSNYVQKQIKLKIT